MKRFMFLGIPLLVGLGTVVAIATAALAFPTAAQDELDIYLDHLISNSPAGTRQAEIVTLDRARRPWNLTADRTFPVFGAARYYQTDSRYDWPTVALETPIWSEHVVTSSGGNSPALPFPPEEVWCALLADESQEQVIFVARHHREPYFTEWVIHQGPRAPFPESLLSTLVEVDCNLGDLH
jgi:hypothetical protein